MAGDELFKGYLEVGASVVGMNPERAESIAAAASPDGGKSTAPKSDESAGAEPGAAPPAGGADPSKG